MDLQEFAALHLPALELDEVRFNVQIAVLKAAAAEPPAGFAFWSLGAPGHCATRSPGRPILLGNLDKAQCCKLAKATVDLDYPGVVGADETAIWFAEHAAALGIGFQEPIPQRISLLDCAPRRPNAPGRPRDLTAEDAPLLHEWMTAFHREAVPHDPPPRKDLVEKAAVSGRFLFWIVDGEPVSVAAISRRLRHTTAIAPVYTPPAHRSRGYGGSVTAAVVERAFAEGRPVACLFTDLRNPMSNRCYAKIGFTPYCDAWHFVRVHGPENVAAN